MTTAIFIYREFGSARPIEPFSQYQADNGGHGLGVPPIYQVFAQAWQFAPATDSQTFKIYGKGTETQA
jgi:hypothetical protein